MTDMGILYDDEDVVVDKPWASPRHTTGPGWEGPTVLGIWRRRLPSPAMARLSDRVSSTASTWGPRGIV